MEGAEEMENLLALLLILLPKADLVRSAGYALSSVRRPGGFAIRRKKGSTY